MIKQKNLGEFSRGFFVAGNVTTGAKEQFVIPYACQLKSVIRRARVAGTTSSEIIDIQKSTTGGGAFASIFSGATKVNSSTTSAAADSLGAFTAGATVFAKGDILSINVTQVNTTPAVDVCFQMTFQRLKGTGPIAAVALDTVYGTEAE